jgi:hypothetical protein
MLATAESLLNRNLDLMPYISNYTYDLNWLKFVHEFCRYNADNSSDIRDLEVIASDTLFSNPVFMSRFSYSDTRDTILPAKKRFVAQFDNDVEDYLYEALNGRTKEFRFEASDGNFHLYYPYTSGQHTVVFLFKDYMSYGKFGR